MKRYLLLLVCTGIMSSASLALADPAGSQVGPKEMLEKHLQTILANKNGELTSIVKLVLGENGADRLFYYPSNDQPYTPKKYGCKYEDVHFKSADGTELHGWFLPAKSGAETAKATIVFSHGNSGSVAHHIGFVSWLIPANYNVLLYDYRAYGKSKGTLSRKGIVEDVTAAFNYVATRRDVDATKLISFSHSLGGAKSIAAIATQPVKGLRAVVTDSAFTSYQAMARLKGGEMAGEIISDDLSTINYIDKLAPIPLLIIHGTQDSVIPVAQGEALFKKAKEPKTFFKVENGEHSDSLNRNNGEYRKKMLMWLDQVLD